MVRLTFALTGTDAIPTDITDSHDQIIFALIAIISLSVGALVYTIKNNTAIKATAIDAAEANKAVNGIGPDEHRMYDALVQGLARIEDKQHEFDKRWGNLPTEVDDAVGLAVMLHDIQNDIKHIQAQLVEHVTWEMAQKYPSRAEVRAVQDDVSTLLEHDRTRDVEGKRYESG